MALDPISGFLDTKKTSGRDAGNSLGLNATDQAQAQGQLGHLLNYQGSSAALDPIQSSKTATSEVQNNDILGQLYGKGGTLDQTNKQEQDLATRGFSLKPEDYEAYGQGSDQIARNFGGQEQGLAQALSDRGLSNSGSAATSFTGLQGNKMEQLGQMQRQIANDRMKSNMDRLGQTRSFLSQMGQQAGNEIQNQFGRQQSAEGMNFGEEQAKNNAAYQRLSGEQNQANVNMAQRQGSEASPAWASGISGAMGGAENGGLAALSAISGGGGKTPGSGSTGGLEGPKKQNGSY